MKLHGMGRPSFLFTALAMVSCTRLDGATPIPPAHSWSTAPMTGYKMLYAFGGGKDGVWPTTGLSAIQSVMYGTTYGGGASGSGGCKAGCGTVYSVTTSGEEKVLHRFAGGPNDGAIPEADLTVDQDTLYGNTFYGGKNASCAGRGCGTIFKISPSGTNYRILHNFAGRSDGSNPSGPLKNWNGALYGTTTSGLQGRVCAGDNGVYGTLFKMNTSGDLTTLHQFAGGSSEGACPIGRLAATTGTLYGVTYEGGTYDAGTIFSLSKSGTFTTLYSFDRQSGDYPIGLVAFGTSLLYVTASADGDYGKGAVIAYDLYQQQASVLYAFGATTHDGTLPYAAAIVSKDGSKLWGTTEGGGACGVGTVYELSSTGTESILYSFLGDRVSGQPDGSAPTSPVLALNGQFFGTTVLGGNDRSVHGLGTVFVLSPSHRGRSVCPARSG